MKDNGGPAFPGKICTGHTADDEVPMYKHPSGMSLRDWFAGMALQGMHARDTYDHGQATPEQRASLAYIDADAMIKKRGVNHG